MASDNVALGLALFAFWLSDRPPTPNRSFGYRRSEILAALFNGVTIVAVSIWIFYEAYRRFLEPPEVLGGWMMVVAVAGLVVNLAGAIILQRSAGENLNMQGAFRHILADLLGSVGVIVAAGVILLTGWSYADPLISVVIGILVLFSSFRLLRDSTSILLESAPPGMDGQYAASLFGARPHRVGHRATRRSFRAYNGALLRARRSQPPHNQRERHPRPYPCKVTPAASHSASHPHPRRCRLPNPRWTHR